MVSDRQKHNGMSWSKPGSVALAAVAALVRNQEYKRWFHTGTLSFAFSPSGSLHRLKSSLSSEVDHSGRRSTDPSGENWHLSSVNPIQGLQTFSVWLSPWISPSSRASEWQVSGGTQEYSSVVPN